MTTSDPDRARRFARRRSDVEGEDESLTELRSELVLLREENARLKAAEHPGPAREGLPPRGRARAGARAADAGMAAETTKVLVEGLVIRESLLEICRQIERVMVSFEARLRALPGGQDQDMALQPPRESDNDDGRERGGHWSEPPRLNGSRQDGAARA